MEYSNLVNKLPISEIVENEQCKFHTMMTMKGLAAGAPWAFRMLDSSSKLGLPTGVLAGNIYDLGNFDECIEVNVKEEWGSFKGQHCMAITNSPDKDLPIRWSLCLPSSCTANDLSKFLSTVLGLTVYVTPQSCHTQTPKPFTFEDTLAVVILSIFALICILSTLYDYIVTDPDRRRPVLLAFSWYSNAKLLFSTTAPSADAIQCLHGMRFLSAVMIIFGHVYVLAAFLPAVNLLGYKYMVANWSHTFIYGDVYAVESFLIFSGFLLCYLFLKNMENGVKFKLLTFYISRYIRLTPVVAIAFLIHAGLIMQFATGPLWDLYMQMYPIHCKKNWWTGLLYLQNYVNNHEACIQWTWYLAVDTQLYMISPLLLLPLFKWPRKGLILLCLVTIASMLSTFLHIILNEATVLFTETWKIIPDSYVYTHTRATTWLMGMLLGYLIHHQKCWREEVAKGIRNGLSKTSVSIGWIVAIICLIVPTVWSHRFTQYENVPSQLEYALFLTITRPIWAIGVCWIIFACTSGYGGFVNSFLSWNFFVPLSRLTYIIYILHISFISVRTFSSKSTTYLDDFNQIYNTLATVVGVTLLAIPAYLTFEAPTIILLKSLLQGQKTTRESQGKIK